MRHSVNPLTQNSSQDSSAQCLQFPLGLSITNGSTLTFTVVNVEKLKMYIYSNGQLSNQDQNIRTSNCSYKCPVQYHLFCISAFLFYLDEI